MFAKYLNISNNFFETQPLRATFYPLPWPPGFQTYIILVHFG